VPRYLARRLLALPPLLQGVSLVIFLVLRASPGDPAERVFSDNGAYAADRQAVAALRTSLGLDLSLPVQYGHWLRQVVVGDFGRSYASGRQVIEVIGERLPATLRLTGVALAIALAVGAPLGIVAAAQAGRPLDALSRLIALVALSVPSFWLGLLLIWTFAVKLGWRPAIGAGGLRHLLLPGCALAAGVAATQARLIRASLLEVLDQPYTVVARAKGVAERNILLRRALGNALIPPVTALGLSLGSLLGGAAVVETVFAYPGLGKLAVDAIAVRDYPVIQAFVVLMTLVFVLAGLLVDLLHVAIDPRVRPGATTTR
jgi:ABC-type dipeptide/oligopeptide/nickel transport system permease component